MWPNFWLVVCIFGKGSQRFPISDLWRLHQCPRIDSQTTVSAYFCLFCFVLFVSSVPRTQHPWHWNEWKQQMVQCKSSTISTWDLRLIAPWILVLNLLTTSHTHSHTHTPKHQPWLNNVRAVCFSLLHKKTTVKKNNIILKLCCHKTTDSETFVLKVWRRQNWWRKNKCSFWSFLQGAHL